MPIARKLFIYLPFLAITIAAINNIGCNGLGNKINIDISKEAFEKLSDYNLFKGNMADLVPNDGLIPYDLNSALFSDYAEKARFVWVPKDALVKSNEANYNERGLVNLPIGSVLVKNFYYQHDVTKPKNGRRIIETRLLIHRAEGWDAETYVWNDEQTEATREIAGTQKKVSFINAKGEKINVNYSVPNKNQCIGCHEQSGKITPIGPKLGNLNRDYHYAEGTMNQLAKWQSAGILGELPKSGKAVEKFPVWNDEKSGTLENRARAYLEINCAHCHNPKGPAKNSGLDLTFQNTDETSIGIGKYPVAAGTGAGNKTIDIDPGHPDNSILVYRMESLNQEVMMPEIGRTMVHTEGVKLIRDWVSSLKPATTTLP